MLKKIFGHSATISDLRANTNWRKIIDRSHDPFVLTYKAPFAIPKDKEGFDDLLMVCWAYDDEGCRRLPDDAESRVISFCTDELRKTIDRHPSLVFVLFPDVGRFAPVAHCHE